MAGFAGPVPEVAATPGLTANRPYSPAPDPTCHGAVCRLRLRTTTVCPHWWKWRARTLPTCPVPPGMIIFIWLRPFDVVRPLGWGRAATTAPAASPRKPGVPCSAPVSRRGEPPDNT